MFTNYSCVSVCSLIAPVYTCALCCQQVLQDNLPRFTPPQLAALLACHCRLGLDVYGKLLRKTAAEYLRRPVPAAGAELLLGVLSGLAAGGSATVKELPPQLLAK
jgi:hypothetical protein